MARRKRIQFKVEKDRVLVPVGEPCPFGCRYCYTRGGEVGPARVEEEEILQQLRAFLQNHHCETIQFGYDGDPFARPERGISLMRELCTFGIHLNFSTKGKIEESSLQALAEIQLQMRERERVLSAFISLSCWESAPLVEPHTPTPQERIASLFALKKLGLPVFIAVRPILPNIDDNEYEKLVEAGLQAGCDGFILGPLYADDRGQFVRFIAPDVLANVPSRRIEVSWSAHTPTWTRYEDEARLQRISMMVERKGGKIFTSSADAVRLANEGVFA